MKEESPFTADNPRDAGVTRSLYQQCGLQSVETDQNWFL